MTPLQGSGPSNKEEAVKAQEQEPEPKPEPTQEEEMGAKKRVPSTTFPTKAQYEAMSDMDKAIYDKLLADKVAAVKHFNRELTHLERRYKK